MTFLMTVTITNKVYKTKINNNRKRLNKVYKQKIINNRKEILIINLK